MNQVNRFLQVDAVNPGQQDIYIGFTELMHS